MHTAGLTAVEHFPAHAPPGKNRSTAGGERLTFALLVTALLPRSPHPPKRVDLHRRKDWLPSSKAGKFKDHTKFYIQAMYAVGRLFANHVSEMSLAIRMHCFCNSL